MTLIRMSMSKDGLSRFPMTKDGPKEVEDGPRRLRMV